MSEHDTELRYVRVSVTREEYARICALAERESLTVSQVMRQSFADRLQTDHMLEVRSVCPKGVLYRIIDWVRTLPHVIRHPDGVLILVRKKKTVDRSIIRQIKS